MWHQRAFLQYMDFTHCKAAKSRWALPVAYGFSLGILSYILQSHQWRTAAYHCPCDNVLHKVRQGFCASTKTTGWILLHFLILLISLQDQINKPVTKLVFSKLYIRMKGEKKAPKAEAKESSCSRHSRLGLKSLHSFWCCIDTKAYKMWEFIVRTMINNTNHN